MNRYTSLLEMLSGNAPSMGVMASSSSRLPLGNVRMSKAAALREEMRQTTVRGTIGMYVRGERCGAHVDCLSQH